MTDTGEHGARPDRPVETAAERGMAALPDLLLGPPTPSAGGPRDRLTRAPRRAGEAENGPADGAPRGAPRPPGESPAVRASRALAAFDGRHPRAGAVARQAAAPAVALARSVVAAGQGIVVGSVGACVPLFVVLFTVLGLVPDARAGRRERRAQAKRRRARLRARSARLIDRSAVLELDRIHDATGVRLPAPPVGDAATGLDAARGRRLVYWLLRLPISLGQAWGLSVGVGVPLLLAVGALSAFAPDPSVSLITTLPGLDWAMGPRRALVAGAGGLVVGGLAFVLLPGWSRALDVGLARTLLAHDEAEELTERVHELRETREQAVDSAEAERRRIERDLHDGAQQRLVALSMLLGRAQARTGGTDSALAALLAEARTETAAAIGEIRDLTRGLHPPVLTDRGLDAALSAVAARAGLPVDVRVDLPRRPSTTVEAVVYFAVCEALTNVAKHARASRAWVRIEEVDTGAARLLRAVVVDDGVGGADLARGSGLRGLDHRLAGVDGRLEVASPAGGPTEIAVTVPIDHEEGPCAS